MVATDMSYEKSTRIKGLAWDHERCCGPLDASIPLFKKDNPHIEIQWDKQPLSAFGEGDLNQVLKQYDLLIIDHPFIGEASEGNYFHDLKNLLPDGLIEAHSLDAVGPSFESYCHNEQLLALPIDTASQVAVSRPDIMESQGWHLPRTYQELIELSKAVQKKGLYIGYPAADIDIMCSYLTISAALGSPLKDDGAFTDFTTFSKTIGMLKEMLSFAHPDSLEWNPIQCYDYMIEHDDIPYSPLGFGYLNYSASAFSTKLSFHNIVAFNNELPARCGLLGGAGIAISKHSDKPQEAAKYLAFLCSPEYQSSGYIFAGGQPAFGAAWRNKQADEQFGHFFSQTLEATEHAYLRPRFSGFMTFFRSAMPVIASLVTSDSGNTTHAWKDLSERFKTCQPSQAKTIKDF
ncbi:putative ABC-type sugar transport system,periplasmic component [Vibrio nigripulchritudo SFn27]|nr:putative ABC-type sugar transport system,periplasmic component [Vibrio nigripulchritudo BLFn1]CCN86308.1 putative ABC-type sugar transport system,periplasmic component [Vibrio nigripulchritudo SFn27]